MSVAASHRDSEPSGEPDSHHPLVSLLALAALGDDRAFERFYDATCSRAFGLAVQILRDRTLAEETTLEVYTQVWKQAARYDPAKGTPLGWLLTLTRTRAIDALRHRARAASREESLEAAALIADSTASPESMTLEGQDAARVRRALAKLPPPQRDALLAAYFAGRSHSEIATAFGRPLGTVKTHIRAGLIQLRSLLEEIGGRPV